MTATAVLCALLISPAAPVPKEKAEAERVLGTWKLVKSSNYPDGFEFELLLELTAGGKITIRQTNNGRTSVYAGEYKLEKGELPYTVKLPNGGEKKETLKIKKLTETQLHVVDPDDIQEDFERVKVEKKEDPKPEEKK